MSVLLILMLFGLVGLAVMALPGLFHHGHAGGLRAGHLPLGRLGAGQHAPSGASISLRGRGALANAGPSWTHWFPGPRTLFSLAALVGAFGNVAQHFFHLPLGLAAAGALVPAIGVELWVLKPLWRWSSRFQGQPSGPLEGLVMERAHAVTTFRNGRGVVRVQREGRVVQFGAELIPAQRDVRIRVGDPLQIEAVDVAREFVTVSVL